MDRLFPRLNRHTGNRRGARVLLSLVAAAGLIAVACSTSKVPEPPVAAASSAPVVVAPGRTPAPTAEVVRTPLDANQSDPSSQPNPDASVKQPPAPLSSVSRGESVDGPTPAFAPPIVPPMPEFVSPSNIHDPLLPASAASCRLRRRPRARLLSTVWPRRRPLLSRRSIRWRPRFVI